VELALRKSLHWLHNEVVVAEGGACKRSSEELLGPLDGVMVVLVGEVPEVLKDAPGL